MQRWSAGCDQVEMAVRLLVRYLPAAQVASNSEERDRIGFRSKSS